MAANTMEILGIATNMLVIAGRGTAQEWDNASRVKGSGWNPSAFRNHSAIPRLSAHRSLSKTGRRTEAASRTSLVALPARQMTRQVGCYSSRPEEFSTSANRTPALASCS